jgi:aspartyl protease family protein
MTETKHPGQRLGRGMMIAGWVLLLVLLTLLFNDWFEGQRNPNREVTGRIALDSAREVVLMRNRQGHYLATGQINGEVVEFLLDTGASDVSIPATIAARARLERGPAVSYQTANGTITAYQTRIPLLELGNIALHDIRASINPHMQDETILLGMTFLKHLEFTQRGDTLILRQIARDKN